MIQNAKSPFWTKTAPENSYLHKLRYMDQERTKRLLLLLIELKELTVKYLVLSGLKHLLRVKDKR